LIRPIILFTGISSIVTQLLTIRECYAQFHGNAFVIAMIFFVWLIAGATGTFSARFCPQFFQTFRFTGILCILLAFLPSIQILGIRFARHLIFIPGTEIGFYQTFLFVLVTFWSYAFMIGFALPFTYFVFERRQAQFHPEQVYIFDSAGDALGGFLFSFIFVSILTPVTTAILVNTPLLVLGIMLCHNSFRKISVWVLLSICLILYISPIFLETDSLELFQGKMIQYQESCYGRIQVFKDKDRLLLLNDGIPNSNERNIAFEESMVHFGLSQLDQVKTVLTVSANKGMLQEIRKYGPSGIHNIEIDAVKGRIEQKFGFLPTFHHLKMIYADGRKYLQETQMVYDAIILNLPEPDTFQVNRFFTQTFFQIAKQKMHPQGVIVFCIDGFDNYLSHIKKLQISTLKKTAQAVFSHVSIFPGERTVFVCRSGPIQMDIPALLNSKKIPTHYIQYYFHGDISLFRIQYLQNQLTDIIETNQDKRPVLVRLTVQNWLSAFHTNLTFFMVVLVILCTACAMITNDSEFVLFSSGMSVMGFEILLIFLFQMIFGDVYYQICWIVTFFLIGLLPGAWISSRWKDMSFTNRKTAMKFLMFSDLIMILVIFIFFIIQLFDMNSLPFIFFLLYGLILSMICGFQFPLALQVQKQSSKGITRFFAADILGAAFGIVMVSIIGIPFYGIAWTVLGLGFVKTVSLLRLARSAKK